MMSNPMLDIHFMTINGAMCTDIWKSQTVESCWWFMGNFINNDKIILLVIFGTCFIFLINIK